MTIEITMPRLSDTMEKGTIIKWHIAEGDEVSAGDVLADVETDKATMEMQSFDDGTVNSLAVDEGQAVDVGYRIDRDIRPKDQLLRRRGPVLVVRVGWFRSSCRGAQALFRRPGQPCP